MSFLPVKKNKRKKKISSIFQMLTREININQSYTMIYWCKFNTDFEEPIWMYFPHKQCFIFSNSILMVT
jgi:hypothetical protein